MNKYRAWDGEYMHHKETIPTGTDDYGTDGVNYGQYDENVIHLLPMYEAGNCLEVTERSDGDTTFRIFSAIVMQFTGKQDSLNGGQDVYDEDIIENCDTKDLQIVYWNEDEAAWYCRYIEDEKRIVSLAESLGNLNKVVGNVHEHPELMNGRHEA